MSFVIATPDLVESAASDLAGIRSSLAEAASTAAFPTTGIASAAQDEVSLAVASLFGNVGQEFQALSARAQVFHAQFVEMMNAGAGAYAVSGIPSTLAAGGVSNFTVVFAPEEAGAAVAWLDIHNNASTPYRLYLSGTGLAARIAVTGDGAFGETLTGGTTSRTFGLVNAGDLPLTVDSAVLSDGTHFSVSGVPATVPAGGASGFTVSFEPDSDGAKTDTLTLTGPSPDSPVVVNLSGTGITEPRFAMLGVNGAVIAKENQTEPSGDFSRAFTGQARPGRATQTSSSGATLVATDSTRQKFSAHSKRRSPSPPRTGGSAASLATSILTASFSIVSRGMGRSRATSASEEMASGAT